MSTSLGVTFAYDLCLGRSRERWKCLVEEYNRGTSLGHANDYHLGRFEAKKCHLVPQNGPGSLGPKNHGKTPKLK